MITMKTYDVPRIREIFHPMPVIMVFISIFSLLKRDELISIKLGE